MFNIRIEEVNYYYNFKCEGELPKVKAEILIRDENNFMSSVIKGTYIFDVLSYNTDSGVGAIELIIEEIVKKLWTELHRPIPKEKSVRIDMYLPFHTNNAERYYMNNLFTKYLVNERARDKYYRLQSNSRFGFGDFRIEPDINKTFLVIGRGSGKWETQMKMLEHYIKTGKVDFVPNRDIRTLLPESCYIDTDLADSIMDTCRYTKEIAKDRAKAKEKIKEYEKMKIENVIFNDPATIVFWRDGSKTVVKAKDEPFDPEKGLAMAIAKKAYGNEGNYYNEIKKFIKDVKEESEEKNE